MTAEQAVAETRQKVRAKAERLAHDALSFEPELPIEIVLQAWVRFGLKHLDKMIDTEVKWGVVEWSRGFEPTLGWRVTWKQNFKGWAWKTVTNLILKVMS